MSTRVAIQPMSSWLWPAVLCVVAVGLVSWVDRSAQLWVGVFGALVIGCAVALREHRLWTLCSTDPLTGLANRRGFHQRYEQEIARMRRANESLALVLVDCDRFKQINDTYGHEVGDRALKLIGAILESTVRRDDVVARWGGDEFVVLLRGVDDAEVRKVAERVGKVLQSPFGLPAGLAITVSFGCVFRDANQVRTEGLSGLLSAADSAMYAAKRRGGGQFASWSERSDQRQQNPGEFDQPPIQTG